MSALPFPPLLSIREDYEWVETVGVLNGEGGPGDSLSADKSHYLRFHRD